jgi:large subunit ribosomal protein L19
MRNAIIEKLLAKTRRTDLPKFGPGDTVRVQVKIREGEKERLQAFEGVVIARTRGAEDQLWTGSGENFPARLQGDRQD